MKFLILTILLIISLISINGLKIKNNDLYEIKLSSGNDTMECNICKFLVERVEIYVEAGSTENQIEYILDKDCNYFGEYANPCKVYVNQYVPDFIDFCENEKPSEACTYVKLC